LRAAIGTKDWENLLNKLGNEIQEKGLESIKKYTQFVDKSVREDVGEALAEVFVDTVSQMIDGIPETEVDP
jgi:hypothetical protein